MSLSSIMPVLLPWELAELMSTRRRLEDGPKGLECENGILPMVNNQMQKWVLESIGDGDYRSEVVERTGARGPNSVPEQKRHQTLDFQWDI